MVPAQDIDAAGATRLTLFPSGDWLSIAAGDAWTGTGTAVVRLDGKDGSTVATVDLPGETCLGMDVGFHALWAGACRTGSPSIIRIDPSTNKIAAAISLKVGDLQEESSVAAGEGAVWALSQSPGAVLVKIDPKTNKVATTFDMPDGLGGVRAAYGGIWIADTSTDSVLRVDPASGVIDAPIKVGLRPRFLTTGFGAVWAMNAGDGTVARIDPKTSIVTAMIRVSPSSIDGGDIAVGGGAVWARISDVLVARIDPATNEVTARYGPPSGSGSVAADDTALWVSAHDVNAVWRLPLP